MPYLSGDRDGMQKIKNCASADCVVGGFRYNGAKRVVGSLLLGLYDRDGRLNHVGFTSNDPKRGQEGLDAEAGNTDRITGLHRSGARWTKPLVHSALVEWHR